jgi:hypothetical protein
MFIPTAIATELAVHGVESRRGAARASARRRFTFPTRVRARRARRVAVPAACA